MRPVHLAGAEPLVAASADNVPAGVPRIWRAHHSSLTISGKWFVNGPVAVLDATTGRRVTACYGAVDELRTVHDVVDLAEVPLVE